MIELTVNRTEDNIAKKWRGLTEHRLKAYELVAGMLGDVGIDEYIQPWHRKVLNTYTTFALKKEYREELKEVATLLYMDVDILTAVNMYYNFVSISMKLPQANSVWSAFKKMTLPGCSAFAYNGPNGPVHARNMDWCSPNNILSKYTMLVKHKGRLRSENFTLVTWPGLQGGYSGIKPGAFSITMNAVDCDELPSLPKLGVPIEWHIRQVFEEANTYDEAVKMLSDQRLLCDCLLMVTGTKNDEMVVIERTPKTATLRHPENGILVVSNDYRARKEPDSSKRNDEISTTSCNRFDRIKELLEENIPQDSDDCFKVLTDSGVRLYTSVQHMVFCPATGETIVKNAEDFPQKS